MPLSPKVKLGVAGLVWVLAAIGSIQLLLPMDPSSFRVPDAGERRRAIGPTAGLPTALQRALDPADDFESISPPGSSDWLANHAERGQTFGEFSKSTPNQPDARRKKIYFQPLGPFAADLSPSLESLKKYAGAFFAMPVEILEPTPVDGKGFQTRTNTNTGKRQVETKEILRFLLANLPDDAFCIIAITMEDLYPNPKWNFVFGQASLRGRVGVYSFARYDPAFLGGERGDDYESRLLLRSCKVLAHETGHMFSMEHCVFFECLMNGSNHLEESDHRPERLCPVCLRKLQHSVGFDVAGRYRKLASFFAEHGFEEEAGRAEKRLRRIER